VDGIVVVELDLVDETQGDDIVVQVRVMDLAKEVTYSILIHTRL